MRTKKTILLKDMIDSVSEVKTNHVENSSSNNKFNGNKDKGKENKYHFKKDKKIQNAMGLAMLVEKWDTFPTQVFTSKAQEITRSNLKQTFWKVKMSCKR